MDIGKRAVDTIKKKYLWKKHSNIILNKFTEIEKNKVIIDHVNIK